MQPPLILGKRSAPEPDLAVVPGSAQEYARAHPSTALLVLEVADRSLPQDRLTKAAIYARAAIPEYWLINLRDNCVEIHRAPDAASARYTAKHIAHRGDRIELTAFPGARVVVSDLLPGE